MSARAPSAAPPAPVFRLVGIGKTYPMGEVEVHALRDVDFELLEGELLVLLGPSGSGKSTPLDILGGLDVPTRGRVVHRGEDLTGAGRDRLTEFRREHVGFQFYDLIPSPTALENVRMVTDVARDPMPAEEALEAEVLSGLDEGEPVLLYPSELIGDGTPVEVR